MHRLTRNPTAQQFLVAFRAHRASSRRRPAKWTVSRTLSGSRWETLSVFTGRIDVDKGWIAGTAQALHKGPWVVRYGFVEPLDDAIRTTPVSREECSTRSTETFSPRTARKSDSSPDAATCILSGQPETKRPAPRTKRHPFLPPFSLFLSRERHSAPETHALQGNRMSLGPGSSRHALCHLV